MSVDIQIATDSKGLPAADLIEQWALAALIEPDGQEELTVRLVDAKEIQALNKTYRDKDSPTNVLSFPTDLPQELDIPLLGDVVVCASVVAREAQEQGKNLHDHWAHMVVHGVLHLQGYDHIDDDEAEQMETIERDILSKLGIADPYFLDQDQPHTVTESITQ